MRGPKSARVTEGAADPAVEGFLALSSARLAPRTVEAYRRDLAHLDRLARPLAGRREHRRPRRLRRAAPRRRARADDDRAPARRRPLLLPPPGAPRRAHGQPGGERRAPEAPADAAAHALARGGRAPSRRGRGHDAAALRDRALGELLYGAGLRVSEAVALDRQSVDLENRLVRCLRQGEQGTGRPDRARGRGRPPPLPRARSPVPRPAPPAGAVPERARRPAHARRRLPHPAPPRRQGRARARAHPPAPPAPLVRDAPARGRRRPARGSGDARACRSRDDRALHARIRSQAARVVFPGAPACAPFEARNTSKEVGMHLDPHVAIAAVSTLAPAG